jgi:hypothetical protein
LEVHGRKLCLNTKRKKERKKEREKEIFRERERTRYGQLRSGNHE